MKESTWRKEPFLKVKSEVVLLNSYRRILHMVEMFMLFVFLMHAMTSIIKKKFTGIFYILKRVKKCEI